MISLLLRLFFEGSSVVLLVGNVYIVLWPVVLVCLSKIMKQSP